MTLNVAVVLKADAGPLKSGLGQGEAALDGFARKATSAAATAERSGNVVVGAFRNARNSVGQLGLQLQDVAVQLGSGASPFRVLAQQGSQIASIFGPGGMVLGALVAVGASLFDVALRTRDAGVAADGAGDSYSRLTEIMEQLEGKTRLSTEALKANARALVGQQQDVVAELDRQIAALQAKIAAAPSGIGKSPGPAAGLSLALDDLERARRAAVTTLDEMRARAHDYSGEATAAAQATHRTADEIAALTRSAGGASRSVVQLAAAHQTLTAQQQRLAQAGLFLTKTSAGEERFDHLTEQTKTFSKVLGENMQFIKSVTGKTTDYVAEAFAGVNQSVSSELGQMVAHGKVALTDFASFTQDIIGQVLSNLISIGLNAGLNSLFAPSTPGPATGPGGLALGGGATSQFHRGGIAGRDGMVNRGLPAWLWADAPRLHGGGQVLRAGEVPAILTRAERVLAPGESAGGNMTVIINDQRSGGGPGIQTRERRGPGGDRSVEVIVRDLVDNNIAGGQHDRSFRARFGIAPATGAT